jgi:hypothetical protein
MISHPGRILRRFGRYEAVEDLGVQERGRCWRAWDPFLERFVRLAELPEVGPDELHRTLPRLDYALKIWLGGGDPDAVLDFSPGGPHEPPFFVFQTNGAERLSADSSVSISVASDPPVLQRHWAARLLGAIVARLHLRSPDSEGRG